MIGNEMSGMFTLNAVSLGAREEHVHPLALAARSTARLKLLRSTWEAHATSIYRTTPTGCEDEPQRVERL